MTKTDTENLNENCSTELSESKKKLVIMTNAIDYSFKWYYFHISEYKDDKTMIAEADEYFSKKYDINPMSNYIYHIDSTSKDWSITNLFQWETYNRFISTFSQTFLGQSDTQNEDCNTQLSKIKEELVEKTDVFGYCSYLGTGDKVDPITDYEFLEEKAKDSVRKQEPKCCVQEKCTELQIAIDLPYCELGGTDNTVSTGNGE